MKADGFLKKRNAPEAGNARMNIISNEKTPGICGGLDYLKPMRGL